MNDIYLMKALRTENLKTNIRTFIKVRKRFWGKSIFCIDSKTRPCPGAPSGSLCNSRKNCICPIEYEFREDGSTKIALLS